MFYENTILKLAFFIGTFELFFSFFISKSQCLHLFLFLCIPLLTSFCFGCMVSYISNEPTHQPPKKGICQKRRHRMNEFLTQEKSIYLQISEMIENDILRDILMEEEKVPSTNDLARIYSINPATAAKGINLLVDSGILYKKRGIGMFVMTGAKELIRRRRKEAFYEDYVKALLNEAASLGISKEELISLIAREDA